VSSRRKELVVVEPMPPAAAKERFIEWRGLHPEIASRLGPQDMILDVISGLEGKTLHSYRILVDVNDAA
jgi:hypothetical protein